MGVPPSKGPRRGVGIGRFRDPARFAPCYEQNRCEPGLLYLSYKWQGPYRPPEHVPLGMRAGRRSPLAEIGTS